MQQLEDTANFTPILLDAERSKIHQIRKISSRTNLLSMIFFWEGERFAVK